MHINAIDHIVLVVRDIGRTVSFYTRVLGMRGEEFRPGRWALRFGDQKINLQEIGLNVDPIVKHPTAGAADFCLLTDVRLPDVVTHLTEQGVQIVRGPGRRDGAIGPLESVYFFDPDENLVEVSNQVAAGQN